MAVFSVSTDEKRIWLIAQVFLGNGFLKRIFYGGKSYDDAAWTEVADSAHWPDSWGWGGSQRQP